MNRLATLLLPLLALLWPMDAAAQTFRERLLELVNVARWDNGQLPPLKGELILGGAAQAHSQAMAERNFFMHCDPDTLLSPFQRMTNAGYAWVAAAENLTAGNTTPEAAMTAWMASSGHRANILNSNYWEIGLGHFHQPGDQNGVRRSNAGTCVSDGTHNALFHYWTQKFGRRSNVYPLVIAREAFQTQLCNVDLYVYGSGFATQMRFSNDNVNWSPWQTYTANHLWDLQGTAGSTVTVFGQIRNGAGTVRSAEDQIRITLNCGSDLIFAHDFEGP